MNLFFALPSVTITLPPPLPPTRRRSDFSRDNNGAGLIAAEAAPTEIFGGGAGVNRD